MQLEPRGLKNPSVRVAKVLSFCFVAARNLVRWVVIDDEEFGAIEIRILGKKADWAVSFIILYILSSKLPRVSASNLFGLRRPARRATPPTGPRERSYEQEAVVRQSSVVCQRKLFVEDG